MWTTTRREIANAALTKLNSALLMISDEQNLLSDVRTLMTDCDNDDDNDDHLVGLFTMYRGELLILTELRDDVYYKKCIAICNAAMSDLLLLENDLIDSAQLEEITSVEAFLRFLGRLGGCCGRACTE
jgi:hypothetical protein